MLLLHATNKPGLLLLVVSLFLSSFFFFSCTQRKPVNTETATAQTPDATPFLDSLSERTFHFFWDLAVPENGNIPDRWPTQSFSSIAATGFGLTAYLVGAERGYITRQQAATRVLITLKFFN